MTERNLDDISAILDAATIRWMYHGGRRGQVLRAPRIGLATQTYAHDSKRRGHTRNSKMTFPVTLFSHYIITYCASRPSAAFFFFCYTPLSNFSR
jgi:hypothetical protein